jgi:hypothetical protein
MTRGDELDRRHRRASARIPPVQETPSKRKGLTANTARGKSKRKFSYPQAFENPRNGEIIVRYPGPSDEGD